MIPAFNTDGHLPVGRYSCTPDDAAALLTGAQFSQSESRQKHWDNIERFLAFYLGIEEDFSDELPVPLLNRMWLGGSFVSNKLEPNNVDMTLFLDGRALDALRGKIAAKKIMPSRDQIKREYGINALFVPYLPVPGIFKADVLTTKEKDYLLDRGRWDDWWQRRRLNDPNELAPSVESCVPVRGYLEVVLA